MLYRAEQVRELDRIAIEERGIAGIQLMKRAGRAVLDTLLECWPEPELITVYCGTGNNGGDGYIVAALAAEKNIPVQVIRVGDASKLAGDADSAFDYAWNNHVEMTDLEKAQAPEQGVIVDALLGTGLGGGVRDEFRTAIEQINQSGLPVIAVDIPSGLCGDSGAVLGCAAKADLTVSFIGLKRGLYTAMGPEYSGEIFFDDLAVPADIYEQIDAGVELLELDELLYALPARQRHDHKGCFGHVLVIGGDSGFGGAVAMAAEAAARCGAGLVSVATQPEHVAGVMARCPELMVRAVANHHELAPLLENASVLVVGPGLGQSSWSEQLLHHAVAHAVEQDKPVVMDADALNLLAEGRVIEDYPSRWLLTPHPGEAARLLDCSTDAVQKGRFPMAATLKERYKAAVILKGAGSLVAAPGAPMALCPYGNPGMASGGMGDVLSGVLGALLAQGLNLATTARLGSCLHGYSADWLAQEYGERGLLASDLIAVMRQLLNRSL